MNLNKMAEKIHETACEKGFWDAADSGDFNIEFVYGTKLALIHSEVSEVLEAMRADQWHLVPEELSDIIIRVLDLAAGLGYDLQDVIEGKMKKNADRPFLHNKAF
jgi:NTP pyrophosphatase (non-canonical NTP hydrolase)